MRCLLSVITTSYPVAVVDCNMSGVEVQHWDGPSNNPANTLPSTSLPLLPAMLPLAASPAASKQTGW
jgi:hypothetical protein